MYLKLKNKITKEEILIDELVDNMISNFFYNFDISLPNNTKDGEYEYQLVDDDEEEEKVIARGLAIIGNYIPEIKEFNNTEKKYKTYGE